MKLLLAYGEFRIRINTLWIIIPLVLIVNLAVYLMG